MKPFSKHALNQHKAPNEAKHRMSGMDVGSEFGRQEVPLLGDFHR
jgi:hypothetical protein